MTNNTNLSPIACPNYDILPNTIVTDIADTMNKRVGGGAVQFGFMNFSEIADSIIPLSTGYDKKNNKKYDTKTYVLERVYDEIGLPVFEDAVVIALVRKYFQDPKDAFIPLGCGSADIEAALKPDTSYEHRELQIKGIYKEPNTEFADSLRTNYGLATEYGNLGNSLEIIAPMYTPGIWKNVKDTQFNRQTGMAIVTKYKDVLWVEDFSINNISIGIPFPSVKTNEAVNISRSIAKEMKLK